MLDLHSITLPKVFNSRMGSDSGGSKEKILGIPWNSLNSRFCKLIAGELGTLVEILTRNSEIILEKQDNGKKPEV